jgi:hypothetical protein
MNRALTFDILFLASVEISDIDTPYGGVTCRVLRSTLATHCYVLKNTCMFLTNFVEDQQPS